MTEKPAHEKDPVARPATATAGPSFLQQLYALAALTLVSTAIGFTMKISQVSGKYRFNPASAVVMTELFKLVSSVLVAGKVLYVESKEKSVTFDAATKQFIQQNFSVHVFKHELGLAVAYSIVNIVTYPIFLYVPASVFFLLKAASPVVTAVMLRVLVNRAVSGIQWFAIITQCIGLFTTQYNPCTGSTEVGVLGLFLIFINIAVSCLAGVWNEHVIKNYGTSVNAQNMILYSCGVVINLFAFYILPFSMLGLDRPYEFFEGYNWSVFFVIIANGSVGLVITAVYKYADVVVKTFGLAGSTVTLYAMEKLGILPSKTSTSTLIVFSGALTVFYAAYLYIAPAPKLPSPPEALENGETPVNTPAQSLLRDQNGENGIVSQVTALLKDSRVVFLACAAAFGLMVTLLATPCE